MAQCVVIDAAASGVLVASAADPCTGLLVLSPAEYAHMSLNPFAIDAVDGAMLAGGIVACWAAAFAWRAAIKALGGADNGYSAD